MSFSNPRALRMLGLGFLAQNLALGLSYGTYGVFVLAFVDEFDAPRALAGSGLAVVSLVMSLFSPLTGRLVARWRIANVMTLGAVIMALGFVLLAMAPSMETVLLVFALIGLGMVLLGPIPAMALVANWFEQDRGKALGLCMIPLGIFVMPPLAAALMEAIGWRGCAWAIAVVLCCALPLLRLVQNRPEPASSAVAAAPADDGVMGFLRDRRFLLITLAYAVVAGGGTAITTHLIPYGRGLGFDAAQAAFMLSVYGAAAATGALVFGWLSDRIGGPRALLCNAALHAVSWSLALVAGPYPALLCWSALMGLAGGGLTIALSATLVGHLDTARFSRGLGLALALNMPFTFGAPPLMGWLFDMTHSYAGAFGVMIAIYVLAMAAFTRLAFFPMASTASKTLTTH